MSAPQSQTQNDGRSGTYEIGRWLLLAVVAVGLVYLPVNPAPKHPAVRHHAAAPVKRVAAKKPQPAPKPPAPKPPSVFTIESAMTEKDLMARWDPLIAIAAKRFAVPQPWIRAVMRMESGGHTVQAGDRPIVSTAGAMGLMQVMPKTYADMRALYGLGKDPFDPQDNILAGAGYLKLLRVKYGYPAMFAAYNDGPGLFEAHLAGLRPLPGETVSYIQGIIAILSGGSRHSGGGGQARLTRPDGAPVMIDAAAVVSLRAALPGEYAPGVQSVIGVGKMRQGVRESLAAARAIIQAHGGGI